MLISGLTVEWMPGSEIGECIREAINLAQTVGWDRKSGVVTSNFNDVMVTVKGDSSLRLILRDWKRARDGYIHPVVGPHPKSRLSKEEKESDAQIRAFRERTWQKQWEKEMREDTARCEALEAKLADAPLLRLADEAVWLQFVEEHGTPNLRGIVWYASHWARLMQYEMARGKSLEEVVEATSHEANPSLGGMSESVFGIIVDVLSRCWKHGKQLQKWYDARYKRKRKRADKEQ